MSRFIVTGHCDGCDALAVWDTWNSHEFHVPSFEWLNKHTHDYIVDDDPNLHWVSCNYCVNHWGTDLCVCGSGYRYDECSCGRNTPYYDINFEME